MAVASPGYILLPQNTVDTSAPGPVAGAEAPAAEDQLATVGLLGGRSNSHI